MMLSMHSTMGGLQDQGAAMQQQRQLPWVRPSTHPRTTTRSICRRKYSTIPTSSGAWTCSSHRTEKRCASSSLTSGDPATAEGIAHVDAIRNAAFEAIKGTPLENARIYIGGTAATAKDMKEGSTYDLLIAGVGALILIFIVMLVLTRAVIAAAVIVGTVAALARGVVRAVGAHLAVHPGLSNCTGSSWRCR